MIKISDITPDMGKLLRPWGGSKGMRENNKNENVVSMDDWKKLKEASLADWSPESQVDKNAEKQFSDYFNILSFSELINESTDIIKELNHRPISTEITMKSKILLSQFSKRLGGESKEVADTFSDMRKKIEDKIIDLNNRI
ncbi:MAG: hypothetical protein ACJAT2_000938 [Bacteriovoracaceae bacterium]|jgi:hypothetical protein